MGDTSVQKVKSEYSPKGKMGQKYLASGIHVSMRLWEEEQPGESKLATAALTQHSGNLMLRPRQGSVRERTNNCAV